MVIKMNLIWYEIKWSNGYVSRWSSWMRPTYKLWELEKEERTMKRKEGRKLDEPRAYAWCMKCYWKGYVRVRYFLEVTDCPKCSTPSLFKAVHEEPKTKDIPVDARTIMNTTMPFGKYEGKRLDDIPISYLDWLLGCDWLRGPIKDAINTYLHDPSIVKELESELRQEDG